MIESISGYAPKVGSYLAMMEDVRRRTLKYVDGLTPAQLSWHPNPKVESIGTTLLHIAAVEFSYIQEDIMRCSMGEEWKIAFPIRLGIPQVAGEDLKFYQDKLFQVREETSKVLQSLTDGDLARIIAPLDPAEGNEEVKYSIEWILYHVMEHEAHHKGQIAVMKRFLPR